MREPSSLRAHPARHQSWWCHGAEPMPIEAQNDPNARVCANLKQRADCDCIAAMLRRVKESAKRERINRPALPRGRKRAELGGDGVVPVNDEDCVVRAVQRRFSSHLRERGPVSIAERLNDSIWSMRHGFLRAASVPRDKLAAVSARANTHCASMANQTPSHRVGV